MDLKEELVLAAQAQHGEKQALATLWDDITPKLYGYLCNVLKDGDLAQDILQQTWLKAITALSDFQIRDVRFSAWLFAIAKNECRQHWRHNKKQNNLITYSLESLESHDHHEEKILIDMALQQLSEEDQEILRLRYIADLSFKDIARVLTISAMAARVRVHRALKRAQNILNQ